MSVERRAIAVILDGPPTPVWQARALERLRASGNLEICEVRLQPGAAPGPLRRWHAAIERRLLHIGRDALAPVTIAAEPATAAAGELDTLVVWLSERPPAEEGPRELLHLRHAGRAEPAEDALRRAVLAEDVGIESEVLLQRSGAEGVLVARTVSELRAFSVTLSRDLMLWKLAELVPRAVLRSPGLQLPAPAPTSPRRAPSTADLLVRSAVAWPRMLVVHAFFRRPWAIRVRPRGPRATAGWSDERDQRLVSWAQGHVYADPFLFEHEGRHHLFCEEVEPGAEHAIISHTELSAHGAPAPAPRPVLTRPYHLSYPFVFEHEGELLMIPETSAVKRIELFRAVDFPTAWEQAAVLLDGLHAADATLLAHDGRLWLFVSVAAENASSLDELHLFWADAPRGPWHAHPLNPVVSDARRARPAGAVQHWGGVLVRPGQDGSRRYGGSIAFCAIDVLSTDDYAEHEIARLDPSDVAGARATHTYSADGRFEAIDLRQREARSRFLARNISGRRRVRAQAAASDR